jgi:hypothetical protein
VGNQKKLIAHLLPPVSHCSHNQWPFLTLIWSNTAVAPLLWASL